jgi:GAF domain-containing protein
MDLDATLSATGPFRCCVNNKADSVRRVYEASAMNMRTKRGEKGRDPSLSDAGGADAPAGTDLPTPNEWEGGEGPAGPESPSVPEAAERRLSAQYAVARVLGEADSLEAAAPGILQSVCETLGWDLGAIWQADPEAGVLRCVAVWRVEGSDLAGFEEATRSRTFEPGIGLPGRAWASGESAWVPDVTTDPNFPRVSAARAAGLHGGFAFPILRGTHALGVLELFTHEVRDPDGELIQMVAATGRQIGQFIQRREAEAELSRMLGRERAAREEADVTNARFRRLEAITKVVMAHLSMEDLLRELLDAVRLTLRTDTATMLLVTEDGKNLAVRAVSGDEEEARGQIRVPVGQGIAGTVAARREPVIVEDVPHAGPYSGFLRKKVASMVAVPLETNGRAIGVMHAATFHRHRFTQEDLHLLSLVAQRAAAAIENVHLYEAAEEARRVAQRAAARTLVLQSVTAALSEAVTSLDVANVVIERGLPVVGATAGAVVLLLPDGKTLQVVRAEGYRRGAIEQWRTFSIDTPAPVAEAVRRGEPIVLRSLHEWKARFPDGPIPGAQDGRSWAAMPMMVEGTAIGALGITFAQPMELEEDETSFLLALARQCGQALERTRLYDAEQEARREAEAARSRLLFLSGASEVFSASLDPEIVLQGIARLVVPELADWCIVDLLEEDGTIRQTAVSHVTPSMEAVARELRTRYPPDPDLPHAVWKVLDTGESDLAEEISDEDLRARAKDQMHLKLLTELGIRSHMVVPLKARGRTLGAVSFVSMNRRYGQDDLTLAEELIARASLAMDNARLFQLQRHVARVLQESLLPRTPPEIRGMDLATRYRAAGEGAEVGGDFYDAFETERGSWVVVVGDVCGKGAEAAAVTGLARNTIRATAMYEERPSAVLDQLNRAMIQQVADGRFCTVCYVRIRPNESGARVTVCSAGHPLPLVLRASGAVETAGRPGRLLGVFPETRLFDQPTDLRPGDAIILYTDGVTEEVRENVHLGPQRLAAAVRASAGQDANGIADSIEEAVFGSGRKAARDDVAIVVLRIPPRDAAD